MPIGFTLPENLKIVSGYGPNVGAAGAATSDVVSMNNLHKLWIIVQYRQADGTDITFIPMQATDVAAGTNAVLANVMPIWSDLDCAASDLLVERTAAVNYDGGTGAKQKLIIFQIDPASLTAGYDCVYITSDAIAAGQYVSYLFIGEPRYPGPVEGQPTVITD